jgi:putative restriction endonuclease
MRAYVGITDRDWFDFLRSRPYLDEVNFWQPSGKHHFRVLKPGELFLFKLHSPYNYIVGGGFFRYSNIFPINLAWASFEEKNGARNLMEMRSRVAKYRRELPNPAANYEIGCILLEQPFFLDQKDWVPVTDWNPNIVQGKGYDLTTGFGLSIWTRLHMPTPKEFEVHEDHARFGKPVTLLPRIGQGSFRLMVTDTYERRCAVTNERTLPVLEAAHIKPYSEGGQHVVSNGILLRSDIHTLFDEGYVTINPSMQFEVSRKIKEEFENGRDYYSLQGRSIRLPANPLYHPDRRFLEWHNDNKFRT